MSEKSKPRKDNFFKLAKISHQFEKVWSFFTATVGCVIERSSYAGIRYGRYAARYTAASIFLHD